MLVKDPVAIPLNPYVGRLVTVDVTIGDDTLKFLLDTGGGKTFLVPDTARRLGCNPSGRSVSFRMNGEIVESQSCYDLSLSIGGIAFHPNELGVWDVNSVLPSDLPKLDGILSLDTLHNQPFTLYLASKQLVLESPESLSNRTREMTKLESRLATGLDGCELTVFLHGKIKAFGWFLLDNGNLEATIVSPHLAVETERDAAESSSTWEAEFTLKNAVPLSTRFRMKNIIYDGALSEEFMRKWVFTFDLMNNSVWALPLESD